MEEKSIVKCSHCGEPLEHGESVCPRCGADVKEDREPKTIYELRAYCARRNMPLEKMRFFLGEDYREPRAFGVYQDDDGDFVVYKNKANGERAVRYRGPDEAHAVNEIYQKLLSEIELRRQKKAGGTTRSDSGNRTQSSKLANFFFNYGFLLIFIVVALILLAVKPSRTGYFYYDDSYYYRQSGDWYYYDDDSWYPCEVDDTLREDYKDYYVGRDYDYSYGVGDFQDSDYYVEPSSNDDDDDWDDWDDTDTDWDSDW